MEHINVVISGFGPYEGVESNPAYEVPAALAGRGLGERGDERDDALRDVEVSITATRLPISFGSAWPTLLKTIEAVNPDIVIATGLKQASHGIRLERCAINVMDASRPDADNALPTRLPIDAQGPAAYWTRLPLRSILADFTRDGIPASLSSDAGTFVCNSLFYNLLNWSSSQPRVLSGFVNFPMLTDADGTDGAQLGLPMNQQIEAGRDVVREAVRYYLQPSSSDILLE
ncbi:MULTISPECIES: pyroglutamyl-peptidase I [Bifidobacterium]|jgi:pyroglutamyl-peptidase|uniref:Pyroglutamyl-peptidase I n=1 Tax=Bifidobacterium tibiigranuli TaxID=2172043 RepID=A0A5N6S2P9_9BIFI|nr:pyroglutamyl-peptidase I [Bifidobacterium tibiigranuli]MCI1242237.1 pyroglutamyl-peptidase I [Bifidobacterium subtile]KAE8128806.1 pyroglutamyl-peptidase I [Bifidobacterium tibiigranuli]KAE8128998.1 pyroglutamyl-peptidase I [Bifidobacterium tibiigranuli]MCH3973724.1 pyroglutamyl-peptidase I [Bifidobacterium tibiigranuli]MCH4189910.1 pyroglutamyl-peptidase I [Bifidobacterium tibiigranuli]